MLSDPENILDIYEGLLDKESFQRLEEELMQKMRPELENLRDKMTTLLLNREISSL